MATNRAWSNSNMWRLAGSLNALRRTVEESQALVDASIYLSFIRRCESLEHRRQAIARDAQVVAQDAPPEARDAMTQRIAQYYRDIGDLERAIEVRGALTN